MFVEVAREASEAIRILAQAQAFAMQAFNAARQAGIPLPGMPGVPPAAAVPLAVTLRVEKSPGVPGRYWMSQILPGASEGTLPS